MAVITISRETGSGGRIIAEKVAQALGYTFVDKHTIGRAYSQYNSDEFGMEVGYVPDFWTHFDSPPDERREIMVDTLNHVILGLAHQDNMVILGRSGFAILAGFADVVNVRIQAPFAYRVKQVMEPHNLTDITQAQALVRESDRVRAGFIEGFYGSQWDKSTAFDVVIDSSKISQELAVQWLIQAAREVQARPHIGTRTVHSILVTPSLAGIIKTVLKIPA